jgi:bacillithiol system protein YtxJ
MATRTPPRFTPVGDGADLDPLFRRSHQEPVVVFKHDPYCSISVMAYREMARLGHEAALVDVAHDRQVSGEIADRTGVRHESPQVIVLRNSRVAWSASHFDISAQAVAYALREAA